MNVLFALDMRFTMSTAVHKHGDTMNRLQDIRWVRRRSVHTHVRARYYRGTHGHDNSLADVSGRQDFRSSRVLDGTWWYSAVLTGTSTCGRSCSRTC